MEELFSEITQNSRFSLERYYSSNGRLYLTTNHLLQWDCAFIWSVEFDKRSSSNLNYL
jgi:CMP-N-acetylneuraminic acid synthetase